MKARTQEMRAKVVEAEAAVPLAMAESFRSGNLGILELRRNRTLGTNEPPTTKSSAVRP
jgi:uncharacterized protein YqfA (UPF0365 family)